MYKLIITKKKYQKNDSDFYIYENIDILLMELKIFIEKGNIQKNDIIKIEKVGG